MRQIAMSMLVVGSLAAFDAARACPVIRPQLLCQQVSLTSRAMDDPEWARSRVVELRAGVAEAATPAGFAELVELLEILPWIEPEETVELDDQARERAHEAAQARASAERQRVVEAWLRNFPLDAAAHVEALDELDWNEQEGALRSLVGRFPDSVAARMALAEILVQAGQEPEALRLAEEAAARLPQDPEALHFLVEYLQDAGREGLAIPVARRWVDLAPGDPAALFHFLALVGATLDEPTFDAWFDGYLEVAESETAGTVLCERLAVPRQRECVERALASWDPARASTGSRERHFFTFESLGLWDRAEAVIAASPAAERPDLRENLLIALVGAGECDRAARVAAQDIDLLELLGLELSRSCGTAEEFESAWLAAFAESDDESLWPLFPGKKRVETSPAIAEAIDARLDAEPTNDELWQLRLAVARDRSSEEARRVLEDWARAVPDDDEPLLELADHDAAAGSLARSADWLEAAWSTAEPGRSELSLGVRLIERLLEARRGERVQELSQQWLAGAEPRASLGAWAAARAAERDGGIDEALTLVRLVAPEAKIGAAADLEALLLYRLGRLDEAEARLLGDASPAADAASPLGRHQRQQIERRSLQLGLHEVARSAFLRSLEADPNDPDAWLGLARAEKGAGRVEAAEAAYRRALEIRPSLAETGFAVLQP